MESGKADPGSVARGWGPVSVGRKKVSVADETKRRNARLVLAPYGTDFSDKLSPGVERLPRLAARHGAVICPWWSAMKMAAAEKPGFMLWDAKVKGHPGLGSVYLNTCAFVYCLTDKSPEEFSLAPTFRGWADSEPEQTLPIKEAKWFQNIAWQAWLDAKRDVAAVKSTLSE